MSILPPYMYVCAWCLQRSKESFRFPGTGMHLDHLHLQLPKGTDSSLPFLQASPVCPPLLLTFFLNSFLN